MCEFCVLQDSPTVFSLHVVVCRRRSLDPILRLSLRVAYWLEKTSKGEIRHGKLQ